METSTTKASSALHSLKSRTGLLIFGCFALAYFLSYAMRSINAVIAPQLIADLSLSNSQLGLLSSAYFISFALLQIPNGFALDRFGVRKTEVTLLIFAALGALLFSLSQSFSSLFIARALIGMGVSVCLMAPFKAFRQWFPIEQQGQLGALMLVIGTSGALLVSVPVEKLLPILGWRGLFAVASLLFTIATALLWFGLPEFKAPKPTKEDPATQFGFIAICKHPYFVRMAPLGFFVQGGFIAIQTLWIGEWLRQMHQQSAAAASLSLLWLNLALVVSLLIITFVAPWLAKRHWTEAFFTSGYGLSIATLCLVLFLTNQGSTMLANSWWLWCVFAFFYGVSTLAQTSVGLYFPVAWNGRVNTMFNFLIFSGAFFLQWGIGLLRDAFIASGHTTTNAFSLSLSCLAAAMIASWLWFLLKKNWLKN